MDESYKLLHIIFTCRWLDFNFPTFRIVAYWQLISIIKIPLLFASG